MDKAAREMARELCKKATPGPWEIIVGGPASQTQVWRDGAQDQFICDCGDFEIAGSGPEDARFISAARTLLPHTLDALDAADSDNARLQARVSELEAALAKSEDILARNLGHQTEKCYDALEIIRDALFPGLRLPAPPCLDDAVKYATELLLVTEKDAETWDPSDADDDSVGWCGEGKGQPIPLTFGHMRRLRKALADAGVALPASPAGDR